MACKSITDMIPDDLDLKVPDEFRRPVEPEPEVSGVPAPRAPLSDGIDLLDREREDLAACEAAIDTLRLAFWAAGKALQVIRDGRLYRGTHPTFEDYSQDRWEMTRQQAS